MTKPGERHWMPISWMLTGSRAVNGLAEEGALELLESVFLERSRRDGRGRVLDIWGEPPGSFLTMILGGPFAPRGPDGEL